jgi:hypothetical protein
MARTDVGICGVVPDRAGCCATVHSGPNGPALGSACGGQVRWAGVIGSNRFPRIGRLVAAYTCDEHRHLLGDPAPYGANSAHIREMVRRRRRDVWRGRPAV